MLFDIDVKGGLRIKEQYPDQTLALFIQPPSKAALEKRLRVRGTEDEEAIGMRLSRAEEELSFAPQFDTVIINDDLELTKKQVVQQVKRFMEL